MALAILILFIGLIMIPLVIFLFLVTVRDANVERMKQAERDGEEL